MNYFELFELPQTFKVDAGLLKQQFLQLSRKYHPDFFAQASIAEQEEALELSSLVNKGYKVLSKPDETIKYVLLLNNVLTEEEKYNLPADFLMDMMDLNDQLNDAKLEQDAAAIKAIKQQIDDLQNTIYEPVKSILEATEIAQLPEKAMLQVKDYYFKKKYLTRILEGLQ